MTALTNLFEKLGITTSAASNRELAPIVRRLVDTNATIRFTEDEGIFSLSFHDDEMNHEVFEITFDESFEFFSGTVGGDQFNTAMKEDFFEEIEERLVSIYYSL